MHYSQSRERAAGSEFSRQRELEDRSDPAVAVLEENDQLEVRSFAPNGSLATSASLVLPPTPAVSAMLFTPDRRFLVLEGTPLRFVRLVDGEVLHLYIARRDDIERLSAPLLFVGGAGEMEGDPELARQLYCDILPVDLMPQLGTAPCRLPRVRRGLVASFFAAR